MSISSVDSINLMVEKYRDYNDSFKLPPNLKCLRCKKLLLNATQTNCGCRYCRECIEGYINQKCLSSDCGIVTSFIPDRAISKEIGKLKIKCIFASCDYEDLLKDIGNHLKSCQYRLEKCPNCKEGHPKNYLEKHLKEDCKKRMVNCPHCDKTMDYETSQNIHLNKFNEHVCPNMEAICPYNCEVMEKVNIKDHRLKCQKKPFPCPYSEIGCTEIVTKENVESHMTTDGAKHAYMAINKIKSLNKELSNLQDTLSTFTSQITSLKDEQIELKRKIENNTPRSLSLATSSTSIRSQEERNIYRNGVYIWKIDNFLQLKRSAERGDRISITSEPFYTKEFGYKMSMKIYPAGDGVGKGTHLSVFFTLMKGEFDDLLPWPFKNKVTLTLIDQINKTNDHSDTFKPDPRSTCYQQPTDEYNIASGSPKFVPFTQVLDTYMKNDTIFLKIQVLN